MKWHLTLGALGLVVAVVALALLRDDKPPPVFVVVLYVAGVVSMAVAVLTCRGGA